MMELRVQADQLTRVNSLEELDSHLDQLDADCDPARPMIATIEAPHNCRVDIGLGAPQSIVIIWPNWPEEVPEESSTYYLSLLPEDPGGTKWFWLHGTADTEFEGKHLIPAATARRVLRHFLETGERSPEIQWLTDEY